VRRFRAEAESACMLCLTRAPVTDDERNCRCTGSRRGIRGLARPHRRLAPNACTIWSYRDCRQFHCRFSFAGCGPQRRERPTTASWLSLAAAKDHRWRMDPDHVPCKSRDTRAAPVRGWGLKAPSRGEGRAVPGDAGRRAAIAVRANGQLACQTWALSLRSPYLRASTPPY